VAQIERLFLKVIGGGQRGQLPSSLGSRSQDHASCPLARKAFLTVPENSQATNTRNSSNTFS
jgi:hypothetical protein